MKHTGLYRTLSINLLKSVTSWEQAVYRAEAVIAELKSRTLSLEISLKYLKELRDGGRPFPSGFSFNSESEFLNKFRRDRKLNTENKSKNLSPSKKRKLLGQDLNSKGGSGSAETFRAKPGTCHLNNHWLLRYHFRPLPRDSTIRQANYSFP